MDADDKRPMVDECLFHGGDIMVDPSPFRNFHGPVLPTRKAFKGIIEWSVRVRVASFVRDAIFHQILCSINDADPSFFNASPGVEE